MRVPDAGSARCEGGEGDAAVRIERGAGAGEGAGHGGGTEVASRPEDRDATAAGRRTSAQALVATAQYLSNAPRRSAAIASELRPSICQRSIMCTSWPSLNSAMDGDEGG